MIVKYEDHRTPEPNPPACCRSGYFTFVARWWKDNSPSTPSRLAGCVFQYSIPSRRTGCGGVGFFLGGINTDCWSNEWNGNGPRGLSGGLISTQISFKAPEKTAPCHSSIPPFSVPGQCCFSYQNLNCNECLSNRLHLSPLGPFHLSIAHRNRHWWHGSTHPGALLLDFKYLPLHSLLVRHLRYHVYAWLSSKR